MKKTKTKTKKHAIVLQTCDILFYNCIFSRAWDCVAQLLGTLRSDDGNGNENVQKTINI